MPTEDHTQDFFTLSDRRELIRQGIQLESVQQELQDIKILINEKFKQDEDNKKVYQQNMETRVRRLEDALRDATTSYKIYLAFFSFVCGVLGTVGTLIVQWFRKG